MRIPVNKVQIKIIYDDGKEVIYPSILEASEAVKISSTILYAMKKEGRSYCKKGHFSVDFMTKEWKETCEKAKTDKESLKQGKYSILRQGLELPEHRAGKTIYEVYNEDEYMEFDGLKKVALFFKLSIKFVSNCLENGTPLRDKWFIDICVY